MLRFPTKEEVIERVKQGGIFCTNEEDYEWLAGEPSDSEDENFQVLNEAELEIEVVGERDYRDGNDTYKTIFFKPYNLYVSMEGYYSSYEGYTWTKVFLSEPYIHTETRYEEIKK